MSSAAQQPRILIVSFRHDEPVRAAASLLGEAGAAINLARDAYQAMAQLVLSPGYAHLLLDVRDLDETELGIVAVARRYCPGVEAAALALPESETRLSRYSTSIRLVDAAALAARIGDGVRRVSFSDAAATTAESAVTADDETIEHALGVGEAECRHGAADGMPRTPTSADLDDDESAPSMYEAVRARMREGAAPPVRRRPGSAINNPPMPAAEEPVTETGVELTAAEIDALLAIERPTDPHSREAAS